MKTGVGLAIVLFAATVPIALATHDQGCVPGQADPSTLITVVTPDGRLFYWEERDNPLGTSPPIPLSGFLLGGGTWLWEEVNTVDGLQRGGLGPLFGCFPPPPLFPIFCPIDDPIVDTHCGHGPDLNYF